MVTTGKWEPIKTVPLNKPVMLTDGEIIVIGECQIIGFSGDFDYVEIVEGLYWIYLKLGLFNIEDLTHWMSLPLLPEKPFIR